MQTEAAPYLPVNHVFVDYENVKTIDLSVVGRKNHIVHLFLGPQNKRLEVEVVEHLLEHSQAVSLIRSPKTGKNAVDFVLAYHLGQAVLTDPKAYFHLVSRDEGFDALVELLKSRNVKVKRHAGWEGMEVAPLRSGEIASGHLSSTISTSFRFREAPVLVPAAKPGKGGQESPPSTGAAGAAKLLESLTKSAKNRPKRRATLVSHAKSSLGKNATDAQGEAVVEELLKSGKLKIDEKGAVTYRL